MTGQGRALRKIVQAGILVAAIACIVWGVHRGEALVVLYKAVQVCMECIGLG